MFNNKCPSNTIIGLWLILVAVGAGLPAAVQAERSNVVLILIDDLNHYGVTAYGADRISEFTGLFKNRKFGTRGGRKLAELITIWQR